MIQGARIAHEPKPASDQSWRLAGYQAQSEEFLGLPLKLPVVLMSQLPLSYLGENPCRRIRNPT